jgi:hypothetical protein
MKQFLMLLLMAVTAACGGSSNSSASLDPAFSGTWLGPVVVTAPGQQPLTYTGQVVIAAAGATATVANICFNNTGSVTIHGSGESASWNGTLTCSPFATTACSAVTETFTSLAATLNNGLLAGQGAATVSGCGQTYNATFTIAGTKQ